MLFSGWLPGTRKCTSLKMQIPAECDPPHPMGFNERALKSRGRGGEADRVFLVLGLLNLPVPSPPLVKTNA
jgi:hypothetical protein